MIAVYKRDLKAYFLTPLGYIFLSAFYLLSAIPFSYLFAEGSNYLSAIFSSMFFAFLLIISLLTMNLLSEERRHKTDQAILTAPISLTGLVLGKYLAALTVFTLGILITLVYALITSFYVSPDWGLFLNGFLGMYLAGAGIISIGLFVSSVTESQVIAAVVTSAVIVILILMDSFSTLVKLPLLIRIFEALSFQGRFHTFVAGFLDYSNIIYFLSLIAVFLFLTVRMIERRRWA